MSHPFDTPLIHTVLFHPRPSQPGTSRLKDVSDGTIPVEGDIVLGYRLYMYQPGKPTILYFHGNGEVAADYDDTAPLYCRAGASLLVIDYRGYGWSTGRPSIAALGPDVEAICRALPEILNQARLSDSPLYLMGRSLGSAYAIQLASDQPMTWRGLIIESGFARVAPLLARLGLMNLPQWNGQDPVGNLDKIARIDLPLLVIHGEQDSLVPVSEGQALYDASPAKLKEIRLFPGAGHNDLLFYAEDYFAAIARFLVTSQQ